MLTTTWLGRAQLRRQVSHMTGEQSNCTSLSRKDKPGVRLMHPNPCRRGTQGFTVMLSCLFNSAFIPSTGEHHGGQEWSLSAVLP